MTSCTSENYLSVGWDSVGYSTLFVLFNVILSFYLKLEMGTSLIVSSIRCIVQLTVMGYILKPVLQSNQIYLPFLISTGYETVYHQTKLRHQHMFFLTLISLTVSCLTVGIVGLSLIVQVKPFYQPQQFVPIIGLLIGNAMAGIAVGISHCLISIKKHSDRIESFLAMGASRSEAALPLAQVSLRLCMLPTINAMSVMGLISIPGMMTGQILGGADVFDAVRYQQVSMFMMASSTAFATLISTGGALFLCIDGAHRLRSEKVFEGLASHQTFWLNYLMVPIQSFTLKLQSWWLNRSDKNHVVEKDGLTKQAFLMES